MQFLLTHLHKRIHCSTTISKPIYFRTYNTLQKPQVQQQDDEEREITEEELRRLKQEKEIDAEIRFIDYDFFEMPKLPTIEDEVLDDLNNFKFYADENVKPISEEEAIERTQEILASLGNPVDKYEGKKFTRLEKEIDEQIEKDFSFFESHKFDKLHIDEKIENEKIEELLSSDFQGRLRTKWEVEKDFEQVLNDKKLGKLKETDTRPLLLLREMDKISGGDESYVCSWIAKFLTINSEAVGPAYLGEEEYRSTEAYQKLQEFVERRDEYMRHISGIKTGRRGTYKKAVRVPDMDRWYTMIPGDTPEDTVFVPNLVDEPYPPEFDNEDWADEFVESLIDLERYEQNFEPWRRLYLSPAEKRKRQQRLNERRWWHYRLDNTVKAFHWMRKL